MPRSVRADIAKQPDEPYTVRSHRPGDMGWIVHRHGVLYSQEYGWDERFEASSRASSPTSSTTSIRSASAAGSPSVTARSSARFSSSPKSKTVAKLRLLLVEPSARGLGIGSRLVDEVIQFSREAGYKKIELWTHPELISARKIYKAAGFELIGTEKHQLFGAPLTAETWAMVL